MKCTGRHKRIISIISVISAGVIALTSCGSVEFPSRYNLFDTTTEYGLNEGSSSAAPLFARDLCVIGDGMFDMGDFDSSRAESSGIFDIGKRDVSFADDIFQKMYPASTTKILTSLVAIENGDLNETITVSQSAMDALEYGSSTCGLQVGDTVTLEQLLYGLMLRSGNEAANVIAEMIAGSIENFAGLMNERAQEIGATHSHFVNANGLHNDDHYTTVYDLYLIFNEALKNEDFYKIISTKEYSTTYKNSAGEDVTVNWASTNQYLNGDSEVPEGFTVIGGKTGTTNAAGSCLVLLSTKKNDSYISIVMRAPSHIDLYNYMTTILEKFT